MKGELRIPFRRWAALTRALLSGLIGVLAFWGAWSIFQHWRNLPRLMIFDREVAFQFWALLGGVSAIFTVICVLAIPWNLWRACRPWPALIICADGIEAWVFGFVPWEDIERLEWQEYQGQIRAPTLTLVVASEDAVERQMTGWQRWATNWNRRQRVPALTIPLQDVALDKEELQREIRKRCPEAQRDRIGGLES